MGCQNSKVAKTLNDSYKMGAITLSNRIGMAAMTRCRCDPKTGIPNDLLVKYYSQRANAGFILTECSSVSNQGNSFPGSAGIWNKEQVEGWKKVTKAVHDKGGKIILQIWHGGRSATTDKTGEQPLAPSAIPIRNFNKDGVSVDDQVPTEMTLEHIKQVKEEFRQGAIRAKEAGFDGLELHGANGYLVDQFIRDHSNKRTDDYGGSIEKRARFCLEVIDILISVFGADRVGIKLSPIGRYQDMFDSTPLETYTYLLKKLDEKGIAFVELTEPSSYEGKSHHIDGKDQIPEVAKAFRKAFKGTLITNQGHNAETALDLIDKGYADLVTFGKLYITNPDLALRIKHGWELNTQQDYSTFFSPGEKGFTDYEPYKPKTVTVA